jgi:hypothetical protein
VEAPGIELVRAHDMIERHGAVVDRRHRTLPSVHVPSIGRSRVACQGRERGLVRRAGPALAWALRPLCAPRSAGPHIGTCRSAAARCFAISPRRSYFAVVVGLLWPASFCTVEMSAPR